MQGFAQNPQKSDTLNFTDSKGKKQGKWIKIDAGKKKYEGCFKDDKPVGKFTYYHANQKLKAVSVYSDNGRVARTKLYDTDGLLEAEGKYVDKQKDSIWIFYHKGGVNPSSSEEWKKGMKQGTVKTFYTSGKLASECEYKNDTLHGLCKEYFTSGNLKKEYSYDKGLLHGTFKVYFLNQMPDQVGKYEKALKVGDWVEYLDNGKIKLRKTFRGGVLYKETKVNGVFTELYDNGIPKSEVTYKDGKKNGPFKEFYNAGEWKKELKENQEADSETGPEYVEVFLGQKIKMHGNYAHDKLDGVITHYDENGKKTKTETYKEGALVK